MKSILLATSSPVARASRVCDAPSIASLDRACRAQPSSSENLARRIASALDRVAACDGAFLASRDRAPAATESPKGAHASVPMVRGNPARDRCTSIETASFLRNFDLARRDVRGGITTPQVRGESTPRLRALELPHARDNSSGERGTVRDGDFVPFGDTVTARGVRETRHRREDGTATLAAGTPSEERAASPASSAAGEKIDKEVGP
jgi:hypothetical protein